VNDCLCASFLPSRKALSEAALQGHVDICQLLLEHWADANAVGDTGRTPLYRAAFNGHLSAVMLLLQHGSDPEVTDKFFQRPVDVASTREVHNVLHGWGMHPIPVIPNEFTCIGGKRGWMLLPSPRLILIQLFASLVVRPRCRCRSNC
jgi:ankyrin repeat protein